MRRGAWSGLVEQRGFRGGNPVVLGRKFCSRCGRWRPVSDFPRTNRKEGWGLRAQCWPCYRQYQREWRKNATGEIRDRMREYNRIWLEAQRRRAGTPPRQYKRPPSSVVDHVERVFLPVEPLMVFLRLETEDFAVIAPLSARAGISERAIYRWHTGESRHVRLDLADRLALALGLTLWAIWGDTPLIRFDPPNTRKAAVAA